MMDPETKAIITILKALGGLDSMARVRVMEYVRTRALDERTRRENMQVVGTITKEDKEPDLEGQACFEFS